MHTHKVRMLLGCSLPFPVEETKTLRNDLICSEAHSGGKVMELRLLTSLLEKTLESPLDSEGIKPVSLKENQS